MVAAHLGGSLVAVAATQAAALAMSMAEWRGTTVGWRLEAQQILVAVVAG